MMKLKYLLFGILILGIIGVIFISRYIKQEKIVLPNNTESAEKIENLPEHCKDRLYNKGEEGLDCGWTCQNKCNFVEKCGLIGNDETWSGNILINCDTNVPEGVTIIINPSTVVKFKHNRDYKNPQKMAFQIEGTLKAIGTPDKQIWFTSDAQNPINGDWAMLRLIGQTKSEIKYAIVEFAQQGINMWKSDALISHSIIRWNNWEGLYAESFSTALIEYNRVYQNGYNGMAMEQFNNIILRYNLFEKSGTHGLHIDASKASVENNILSENGAAGLSLDNAATVTASDNTISGNNISGIMCGEGDNKLTAKSNKIHNQETKIQCPATSIIENTEGARIEKIDFDYPDSRNFEIDYTPGDRVKDRYQYVYPDDETRKIIKKIGKGLGLTWSITMEGNDVWTAVVSSQIYKLDQNGKIIKELQAPSSQPWGMAFDGKNLWITDFAEKRTYSLDPNTGKEVYSFNNPDQERGAKGLSWDGEFLYIMGWTTNIIYKMDRQGKLMSTFELENSAGGGLTFDGKYFWAPCQQICKYDKNGKLLGMINVASEGTWDLAWEPANNKAGGYLWATQRTNENWVDDEKIYKIEILNDSLK